MFKFSKIISEFKDNKILRENKIKDNNFRKNDYFYVVQYKICRKIYSIQLFLLTLQPHFKVLLILYQGITMIVIKDSKKEEIIKKICDYWSPLDEKEQALLAQDITVEQFRKNEVIYNELDRPGKMMFLIQGKVKIFKDGVSGRNQIVRVIKPIGIFGYRAYFAKEDYKTTAMAFEASMVAFVPMDIIVELMKRNFNVCQFILQHLAVELGQSDDRTINLTQKHIRGRLAEALLFLRDSYGLEEDDCTLSIYLSREDLANMSNMTTSNAIRTLSTFANEKLIAIDGRKIKLINIEELEDISKKG